MARLFFAWWEPWCLPSGGNYKGYKGRRNPPRGIFPYRETPQNTGNRIGSGAPIRYAIACRVAAQRCERGAPIGRGRGVFSCNPCNGNLL
jgi:hypothetical protein